MSYNTEWNEKDKDKLIELRKVFNADWDEIGTIMQRSPAACRVQYNRLLVVKQSSKRNTKWSAKDVNTLKELFQTKTSLKGMAMQLERTEKAIIARMYVEGMMGGWLKSTVVKDTPTISPSPKPRPGVTLGEITASTIFDYVKKLELENKALQQRINEIQKILGGE
jgi:hypothetical protein